MTTVLVLLYLFIVIPAANIFTCMSLIICDGLRHELELCSEVLYAFISILSLLYVNASLGVLFVWVTWDLWGSICLFIGIIVIVSSLFTYLTLSGEGILFLFDY